MKTANFIPKHGGNITPRKWTSLANVTRMRSTKKTNWLQLVTALIAVPFTINLAHAALSAMTAQTIKGSAPYFVLNGTPLTNTNELVGFTYGTILVDASQSTQVTAGNIITLPVGTTEGDINAAVTFNQSTATPLQTLVQTASHPLKVADRDGDANNTLFMDATGTIQATFTKDGGPVAAGSTAQLDPCADYEINITVVGTGTPPEVAAKTTYGDPDSSLVGTYNSKTATYKLLSANKGICYLRPLDLSVYPSGNATLQYFETTGYDPSQWVVGQGFKKSVGFPSTGFKGAVFSLIGSGSDQSHYKCTVIGGGNLVAMTSAATSSLGENCGFTMTSQTRPNLADTITLWDMTGGGNVNIDTYTLNYTGIWAQIEGPAWWLTNPGNLYAAADECGGVPTPAGSIINEPLAMNKLLNASEIISSPYVGAGNAWLPDLNRFGYASRTVGALANEWGELPKYTASEFVVNEYYWMANPINMVYRHSNVRFMMWSQPLVYFMGAFTAVNQRTLCRGL